MIKKKNHIFRSLFLGLIGGCATTIVIVLFITSSDFYAKLSSALGEESLVTFIFVLTSCCYSIVAFRCAKKKDFKELCETYPNGIIKWLRKNGLYSDNIAYGIKIKALKSVKEILREEQSVIDEYHYIKRNCPHVFSQYQSEYGQMLKTCDNRKEIEQKEKEWQANDKKKKDIARYNSIKSKYPNGLKIFAKLHNYTDLNSSALIANSLDEENDIIKLEKLHSLSIKNQKWFEEQKAFAYLCWKTAHDSFTNLGRYKYPIYLPSMNNNYEVTTREATVWQIFTDCFCSDDNIKYTYYKWVHDNSEKLKSLNNKYIYDNAHKLSDFIKKIGIDVSVILNINRNTLLDDTDPNFMLTSWMLSEFHNTNCEVIFKGEAPSKKYVIIVEAITSNNLLKENCQDIISKYSSLTPCLCYVSLMKGYDTAEMQALIDKKKKEVVEKESEKKKIEEIHNKIVDAVKTWDAIFIGFQAISMLDYYPTNSKVVATSEIWNDRHMVWNFKNNPDKVYSEENVKAVEWAVSQAKEIIEKTFGKVNAKYITFVCIPASSQEMTERRYKSFAEKLCKLTGMCNAYEHIKVIHDKAAAHNGGSFFKQDMLDFDMDFFKGRYVLLFDDVITTGSSMKEFKTRLEELGNTVIGGISIGRTKSEHSSKVSLESLGIKLIPKPLFTMGSKPQPKKKNVEDKSHTQVCAHNILYVGYSKACIYNDMPLDEYPAIRFPQKGCIVFPHREGKQFRRGYTEQMFEDFIKSKLPNSFRVIGNAEILLGDECRPYEPDIAIIADSKYNIRIDIEIDEPYNGLTREAIHYIGCGDEFRDLNLINAGWIVMRFTEEQVFCEKEKCLNEIYRLLLSLDSNYAFQLLNFKQDIKLEYKPFWTELDAKLMAANNFRESYLHHNFGNEEEGQSKQGYLKQTEDERELARQIQSVPQLSSQKQKNIDNTKLSFVQDNDIEFFAKEHIYVYKKFIQLKAVSDVISLFFRKFDSIGWSYKKALENCISQRCQLEQWDCKGAESREVGTYLHEQIHKYLISEKPSFTYHFVYNGKEVHDDKMIDISKEYTYFKKFLKEESIVPFRTEWQIFDPQLRIAGTIDFLGRDNDGFEIFDWKRSNKVDRNATIWNHGINGLEAVPDTRYYHYCLQLNLYKYILKTNYHLKVNKMYLVILHPDYQSYQKVEVPNMDNAVDVIVRYCKQQSC